MPLQMPTRDQAARFTRAVDDDLAFPAVVVSASAQPRDSMLRGLASMEEFLDETGVEGLGTADGECEAHYIELGSLADWLDTVLGDTELAGEVRGLHNLGESFVSVAPTLSALLHIRLHQCAKVLEAPSEQQAEAALEGVRRRSVSESVLVPSELPA